MPWQRPAYPPIMTPADWNKRKGVFAKMHGETGMGKALEACLKAYNGVTWANLEIGHMPGNQFSIKALDAKKKAALAELNGPVQALVKATNAVATLAAKVQGQFKASKTIPSSSTKHVGDIVSMAKLLAAGLSKPAIQGEIDADYKTEYETWKAIGDGLGKKLAAVITGKTPGEIAKVDAAIKAERAKKGKPGSAAATFNSLIVNKAARDITQNLTNIVKFTEDYGFDLGFNLANAKKISATMVVWGNSQTGTVVPADASLDAVNVELTKFENAAKAALNLVT
jgi:hypothetical protein